MVVSLMATPLKLFTHLHTDRQKKQTERQSVSQEKRFVTKKGVQLVLSTNLLCVIKEVQGLELSPILCHVGNEFFNPVHFSDNIFVGLWGSPALETVAPHLPPHLLQTPEMQVAFL